ncbi:MAG: SDR family NAD(P)-dependent oxidoreductase, partial [Ignavibacteria bacterium]|nr:SDR family NAD(P)-dependent oxidoreductase [Ignavibacteria bacterium]
MSSFKNKKVLITGGASGIGLLLGKKALDKGAELLIIWDINTLLMEEEIAKLKALGNSVIGFTVDVSSADSVATAATKLIHNNQIPDLLILNAGVVSGKFFHEHQKGEIEQTIGVNVLGCMLPARAFLPDMIKRGSGHLVSISSAAGMLANPKMAVYAASKWAVYGWSESVRLEMQQLKTGVKVTTVTPSYIDTGMFDGVKVNIFLPKLSTEKAVRLILNGIERNKKFV